MWQVGSTSRIQVCALKMRGCTLTQLQVHSSGQNTEHSKVARGVVLMPIRELGRKYKSAGGVFLVGVGE